MPAELRDLGSLLSHIGSILILSFAKVWFMVSTLSISCVEEDDVFCRHNFCQRSHVSLTRCMENLAYEAQMHSELS